MTVDDIHRIARWAGPSAMASNTILGGEPTLNPQVIQIAEIVGKYGSEPPVMFTNGLGDPDIMRELARRPVRFGVNFNHVDGYTDAERQRFETNMKTLRQGMFNNTQISVTITKPDDDFSTFFDFLRSPLAERVPVIRIGISTPGYGFKNIFPKELSKDYGAAYLRLVTAIHRIRPYIGITNECSVNGCLVDEGVAAKLTGTVENFKFGCKGGNFDILPDFSTHWCFPARAIPELRIDDIFKYQNMDHLHYALFMAYVGVQQSLGSQCDHELCDCIGCSGPCAVYNYYRKHRKELES